MQSNSAGDPARCPRCRTIRLKVLPKLDHIDRLYGNILANRIRAHRGDTIYHCIFCRLQFYDPRGLGKGPEMSVRLQPVKITKAKAPTPAAAPVAPPVIPAGSTLFGARVMVRGTIHSSEDLHIEGSVEGTLACPGHRLTIGPKAKVKATVRAADLDVRGTLRGTSRVEGRTVLRSGSTVVGDIRTVDIVIEEGADIKGAVELIRKQPELPLA